jgi:hypothetical protein
MKITILKQKPVQIIRNGHGNESASIFKSTKLLLQFSCEEEIPRDSSFLVEGHGLVEVLKRDKNELVVNVL